MNTSTPAQPRHLRSSLEWLGLTWDVAIMALVAANLVLIVFDSLFAASLVQAGVNALSPVFHDWYQASVHANFITIDLYFVAVFAADVLLGWGIALYTRRYFRWFYYPFVHWYDVMGCVPLAGFRWLRVLRVIALALRLQRLGIINLWDWRVVELLRHYYDILVEEVSDRVVVKVLEGVETEVRSGGGRFQSQVMKDVVRPRKDQFATGISRQLEAVITRAYQDNRADIRRYLDKIVDGAVHGNAAIAGLARVPMLGSAATRSLEWALRDTVYNIVDEIVAGLGTREFEQMLHKLFDSVFEMLMNEDAAEKAEIRDIILEVLELVKAQVRVQRWRDAGSLG